MKVLVVVLNYRTPQLVVRCLESLKHEVEQIGSMRVVVTDNASGDGSVEIIGSAIEAHQWTWCDLIPLPENGGYSVGNNAGIRPYLEGEHRPDYVMLVNPDTYVRPNAVVNLLRFMEAHPEAGLAGSRLEDPDGAAQNGAFRFPGPITELIDGFRLGILTKALKVHDLRYELGFEPMEVDWIVGAAMMIRAQVLDDVGLLDEGYFLYFDEVDFCLQVHRAGWKTYYVPESVVVHLVGQSTGISDHRKKPPRFPQYWFDSRRRFYLKNHGKLSLMAADLAFLFGYTTYRIRRVIQRQPDFDPPRFWSDFVRNSTLVRGFKP
ncbi:MAG TPA: glycosyltransferase family 2 protein [Polyangiales bacterium]|nr:glycosyltransferase family 2 protein [Polyangiales bacterium]